MDGAQANRLHPPVTHQSGTSKNFGWTTFLYDSAMLPQAARRYSEDIIPLDCSKKTALTPHNTDVPGHHVNMLQCSITNATCEHASVCTQDIKENNCDNTFWRNAATCVLHSDEQNANTGRKREGVVDTLPNRRWGSLSHPLWGRVCKRMDWIPEPEGTAWTGMELLLPAQPFPQQRGNDRRKKLSATECQSEHVLKTSFASWLPICSKGGGNGQCQVDPFDARREERMVLGACLFFVLEVPPQQVPDPLGEREWKGDLVGKGGDNVSGAEETEVLRTVVLCHPHESHVCGCPPSGSGPLCRHTGAGSFHSFPDFQMKINSVSIGKGQCKYSKMTRLCNKL